MISKNDLAMNTRKNILDTQTFSDLIILVFLLVGLVLILENFSALQEAFNDVVLGTLHDIKASIAETQAGS
jgi:hypothetical protein